MKRCAWLVLLCACASNSAPQPSSGEALAPLGKNAQGGEEFLRVIDGMVVIKIPAGEFIIGDDIRDQGEGPKRPVTIEYDYYMDKFEVCNEQFARFLNARGEKNEKHSFVDMNVRGVEKVDGTWRALAGREKHPAACATFWGAEAYAQWVGGFIPGRLEWEKAARGTDGRTYPWGSEAPDPTYCNYGPSGIGDTMPVGSYPKGASAYGCMDMAGNVYERVGPRPGQGGGSIKSSGFLCPMAFQMRASDGCGYARDTSNPSVGFRCAMRPVSK
jgi:formylglycine-generating enzyme required for sulfatase activity